MYGKGRCLFDYTYTPSRRHRRWFIGKEICLINKSLQFVHPLRWVDGGGGLPVSQSVIHSTSEGWDLRVVVVSVYVLTTLGRFHSFKHIFTRRHKTPLIMYNTVSYRPGTTTYRTHGCTRTRKKRGTTTTPMSIVEWTWIVQLSVNNMTTCSIIHSRDPLFDKQGITGTGSIGLIPFTMYYGGGGQLSLAPATRKP